MDGVHSSSFKNIAQGERVGARPRREDRAAAGALAGLLSLPVLTQVAPGADQPVVLYQLNSRDMTFRGLLIIFSLGLLSIMTFFLFLFFCVNGYSV